MFAFVRDRQPLAGIFGGLPAGRELGSNTLDRGMTLTRRLRRIQPVDQQPCDALLLAQQRTAGGLGRMRREDRLDADLPEQRLDLLQREAARTQLREALLQPARLWRAAVVHVLPAPAHAMHLLRRVDHLEPGGKSADQLARLRRGAFLRSHHQLHAVFGVALAPADGGLPVTLDGIEDFVAALVPDHLADELAKRMHVVAKRRVLDREKYAFAGHDRSECYQSRHAIPRCRNATVGSAPPSRLAVARGRTRPRQIVGNDCQWYVHNVQIARLSGCVQHKSRGIR